MQKNIRKKKWAYKAAMLLKYWKTTAEEPIMDLCMIIAIYAQDIEAGLLYAVGWKVSLTVGNHMWFENVKTLSRITLKDKDGNEELVKRVVNGNDNLHAFLLENGIFRVIKKDESTYDITLESDIVKTNSGNCYYSLFIIDAKMCAYEIKNETPVKVTGLPNGIKIKDISCGTRFTIFLSDCGRVFGMGKNGYGELGLPRRIKKTEIPTEITFSNQSTMITTIHASRDKWVAVDSKKRAWVVGDKLMKFVHSNCKSLDPSISIIEIWYSNQIWITQIKCGYKHAIALDTEGRVYWFGIFKLFGSTARISSDPIPFSHRIISIRSSSYSVACKDTTNEWYIWGNDTSNHITGLCGCEAVCKKAINENVISNPMRCEWQGLFDSSHVIDLQLGKSQVHVIVDSI